MGFCVSENQNLKINSIEFMQNLFSFQTLFKFSKSIHWLSRYTLERKRGKDYIVMIDNEGNYLVQLVIAKARSAR